MSDDVKLSCNGAVAEIILNRPESLNAMNLDLIEGLYQRVLECRSETIRAVLLRGEGRGFCAGGDIRKFATMIEGGEGVPEAMPDRLHEMIENLRQLPKPVLAAVHGPCAGAGLSLVLACDLAIAAEDCKFNLAYVNIGLSPDGSSSYFLPRHVGSKKATEIFLTGKNMSAQEVLELGLINKVVPAAQVLAEGRAWAEKLAQGPTLAYAKVKELLARSATNDLHAQLALETKLICESSHTEDFKAGIKAFLQKEQPTFKGC